jgi:hypothetical protein
LVLYEGGTHGISGFHASWANVRFCRNYHVLWGETSSKILDCNDFFDNVGLSFMLYTCFDNSATRERGHVKSPTLSMNAWVVGFINHEQTFSLKVLFVEE